MEEVLLKYVWKKMYNIDLFNCLKQKRMMELNFLKIFNDIGTKWT